MAFSKVERHTHDDERFRRWRRDTRDVWKYLLTSKYMNFVGCYVLGTGAAADDLSACDDRWTPARVEAELAFLQQQRRIIWDPVSRLVLIVRHLKFNHPDNPSVARGAVTQIAGLPYSDTVFQGLLDAVEMWVRPTTDSGKPFGSIVSDAIRERLHNPPDYIGLDGGLQGVPQGVPDGDPHQEQEQEQEQEEQEQEQKTTEKEARSNDLGAGAPAEKIDDEQPNGGHPGAVGSLELTPESEKPETVHGYFMPVLRELRYDANGTDGSILKVWDSAGLPWETIENRIRGLAWLRDNGKLLAPLSIGPPDKLTLRIMHAAKNTKHQDQHWAIQAEDAWLRHLAEDQKRNRMRKPFDGVGGIVRQVSG